MPPPTVSGPAGWPAWPPRLTRETAILCCILAVTAVVYLRCLGNAFVLDDFVIIVKNPNLGDWSFLWKGFTRSEYWFCDASWIQAYYYRNYRPLLLVWYWVAYHLFGLNPAPWHASVVALHLLVVWLVFKISRRLAGESTPALLAASLFALTPVHVADVVWIACCGMVLGAALTLAAFYLIMPRAQRAGRRWAAAIALYAGALLCHESMAAFPALVACYAFLLDPNDSQAGAASLWMRARRAVIWQAPFAVELLLYFVVRRLVLGFFVSNPYYYINLLTDAQAVLTVPLVLVIYLTMLVMPWLTLPNHRAPLVSSPLSPGFWLPLAPIALLAVALVVFARRDRRLPLHLFCAAWMGVTFVPMMMLHSVPHLVQDYCLYLPSVGWCMLLGDLIAGIARDNALARRLVLGGACAMLLVYAVALWRVEWFWHDDVAAARGYVEGDPESVEWRWNVATHLYLQGDLADAELEIRPAFRLEPDRTGNIFTRHTYELHRFLGELLARRGDIDGAELEFAKSLNGPPDEDEVHPPRPPLAYNHDGVSLYDQGLRDAKAGRTGQAIREITEGLEMMKPASGAGLRPFGHALHQACGALRFGRPSGASRGSAGGDRFHVRRRVGCGAGARKDTFESFRQAGCRAGSARTLRSLPREPRSLDPVGDSGIRSETVRSGADLLRSSRRGLVWRYTIASFDGNGAPRDGPRPRSARSMPAGGGVVPPKLGSKGHLRLDPK